MPSVGLRSLVPPRGEGVCKLWWVYVNKKVDELHIVKAGMPRE
jgi:hypothetical protein